MHPPKLISKSTPEIPQKLFINGNFVDSHSGQFHSIIDPTSEQEIAQFPIADAVDVNNAYEAAAQAFDIWRTSTPKERAHVLFALAQAIEDNAADMIALEAAHTGQNPALTESDNVYPSADQLRFFGGIARGLPGVASTEYVENRTSIIRREPVGIVGQVAPWNYPLMMAIWKIGPALAAGCTIVLKPSDTTPLSAIKLAQLSQKILPPGVLNIVTGDRATGRLVIEHPAAAQVSITGSVRAGREVALSAAKNLKRSHLELGGKAPVVVFADADLETAAETIAACGFYNAGQDCTAATRVIVHESVYPHFVQLLSQHAQAATNTIEPVNNIHQLSRLEKLMTTIPQHATINIGGQRMTRPGYYFAPTIISDLDQSDALIQEEIFGPVITVQKFQEDAQAYAMANDTIYGLAASVWTQNLQRAMEGTRTIDAGAVWVNDHITFCAEMPHGGFKSSGYGKDMSIYSVEDYTRIKHIMIHTS